MEKAGAAIAGRGDMSPLAMFLAADLVVQAVMVGLLFASFVVWAVLIGKSLELAGAKRAVESALVELRRAPTLLAVKAQSQTGIAAEMVRDATAELEFSRGGDKTGAKERVASHLERLTAAEARRIARAIGLIATIGATAPFVGLFGTVWGIMNSFIGISNAHTTSLAVVAPGIAEALLATACGLIVAIPAVVIYNHFSRAIGGYRALVADAAAAIHRLASRELDAEAPPRAVRYAAE
jgi:biopolymer transport protein ExbB